MERLLPSCVHLPQSYLGFSTEGQYGLYISMNLEWIVIKLDNFHILSEPWRQTEVEDPIETSSTQEDYICVSKHIGAGTCC